MRHPTVNQRSESTTLAKECKQKVLIDKNDLLFRLTAARNTALGTQSHNPQEVCEVFDAIIDLIESFDVEAGQQKLGMWMRDSKSAPLHCSVCLENPLSITDNDGDVFTILPHFCPHCGAKMDGD